jgi:hypothetical protein
MNKVTAIRLIATSLLFLGFIYFGYRLLLGWQSSRVDPREDHFIKVNLGDFGFFSGVPSGPPCYLEICPQKSTKKNVIAALEKYGLTAFCPNAIKNINESLNCDYFVFILFDSNDYVSRLDFSVFPYFSIDQILSKYGVPESFYIDNYSGINGISKVSMVLFYDRYQMVIGLAPQDGEIYDLSGQSEIVDIIYFDEAKYTYQKTLYKKVIWKGFGKYAINGYQNP